MPLKVMTIVGTRPELIKLSRVITELDTFVEHVLVHTQQNFDFELSEIFFEDLGIRKPDHLLGVGATTPAETIANIIARTDVVIEAEKPDALLVLGDTNSCLAVIAAKKRRVPIFHMEAGNRSFDQRVPEEMNRRLVDHLSDINLPYTEHARGYLLREGLRPETVIKTGSPMKEVLEFYRQRIDASDVIRRLGLTRTGYIVVSAHREENVDDSRNFRDFLASLTAMVSRYKMPVVVSTHPRTRNRLERPGVDLPAGGVQFLKPLSFSDYIALQLGAFCVVSDSGTLTEEASLLGFPAVTIRQAHERPEGMDEGTLVMCGLKPQAVLDGIDLVTRSHREGGAPRVVPDYDTPHVAQKVVRIIVSYTDYVRRTVWFDDGEKELA
jgi:UDP-N-acetylglucosamine 2-epimerase (non-hydrolysing)